MEARCIMQFVVDELRKTKDTQHQLTVDRREGDGTIIFREEDIDNLQKLLNIADLVEEITRGMMKQFLVGIKKNNLHSDISENATPRNRAAAIQQILATMSPQSALLNGFVTEEEYKKIINM